MVVLIIGVFMMGLTTYAFSPAIHTIVREFHTSYDMVSWVLIIYMLISTAIMPLTGKLSDVFGRKRLYIAGVLFFMAGYILTSLSWDIYSLIAFRAIQAIGGGIIMPSALAAMSSAAPPDKQGKTIGALGSMGALAMIVGPNVGGYIIQNFGWRAVFYINLPIGIVTVLLALMFKESYGSTKHHIDVVGSALLGAGLAALLLGLDRFEALALTDITVFPLFLATALLALLLYVYEKRTPEPILNMPVILRGDVLSLNLTMMAVFFGIMCTMTYASTFAQLVLNLGIQDSGMILTPLSVAIFICTILGGALGEDDHLWPGVQLPIHGRDIGRADHFGACSILHPPDP